MQEMKVLTLIMASAPSPCILVLQSADDFQENPAASRILPIWVGPNEATGLGVSLEHLRFIRPMTHDLFLDALTSLDAMIDHVLIYDVKGTVFYSRLVLRQHGRLIELDARPSDAIALALRENAPIYAEDWILDKSSYPYLLNETELSEEEQLSQFHKFLEQVTPEDFTE